jgi:hypothetical protein
MAARSARLAQEEPMDTRITPGGSRNDVAPTGTATRVTPSGGAAFKDMVVRGAGAVLKGAEAAISSLPGAPIVAAAVRPSAAAPASIGTANVAGTGLVTSPGASAGTAENPLATGTPGQEGGAVENTLAQSQAFNLYYLQLQEQLSAENRAYTAMSNVLKARHDTIKNAIGNIR